MPHSSANPSPTAKNRDFPALRFVARVIDIISWVYLVFGLLAAVGFAASGWQEVGPASLLIGILIAFVALLVTVFIRASAELIRLALYVATLLEDIRQNTA